MVDRIIKIMDDKNLSSSSFADKIKVSRGAISHLLNGRIINGKRVYNDPSKRTVELILVAFPDISSSWFWRGEGPMYKYRGIVHQRDIFEGNEPVDSQEDVQEPKYPLKKEPERTKKKAEPPINQDIISPKIPAKKVDRIIIYFNDKTFVTFIPEE